jgi:hypothetical protein
LTEEEIVDCVNEAKNFEDESGEEHEENRVPKMKPREKRDHLNCVMNFIQESDSEDISAYYDHLRHLRDLIIKEMCAKPSQKKIDSFCKPISTITTKCMSPRTSCSKMVSDDL